MTPRRHLLTAALALGLLAGCSSRNAPPPESRPAESGGTPSAQAETPSTDKPAPAANPSGEGENPSGGTAATNETVTYFVRDSGIRCIAPPCPAFIATRADRPNEEGIQITDIDLNSLNLTQEKRDSLLEASHTAPGIKVEAILGVSASAGPSGPAKILRITRIVDSK
jgi:hypothetical protein